MAAVSPTVLLPADTLPSVGNSGCCWAAGAVTTPSSGDFAALASSAWRGFCLGPAEVDAWFPSPTFLAFLAGVLVLSSLPVSECEPVVEQRRVTVIDGSADIEQAL